jgi:hypothetical protein
VRALILERERGGSGGGRSFFFGLELGVRNLCCVHGKCNKGFFIDSVCTCRGIGDFLVLLESGNFTGFVQ